MRPTRLLSSAAPALHARPRTRRRRAAVAPATGASTLALLVVAAGLGLGSTACSDDESSGTGLTPSGTPNGGAAGAGASGGAGGAAGGGGAAVPTVRVPRASILPEELAVLVNTNDAQSVAVASYYVAQRQIPADNVVDLSFVSDVDVLPAADFADAMATVEAAIGPDIQAFVLSWTRPYRVDCMSITTAFAVGEFDTLYCSSPCDSTAAVDTYDSDSLTPYADHGIRPSMSLAAADQAGAFALIDRGVASDGTRPMGDGYFLRTTDSDRSVRWPTFLATVDDWDYPEGLALTYLDNSDGSGSNVLSDTDNVLFYFTGLAQVPSIDTNTYLPGAVADHLTSYGGQIPTSGQMSIVRWLEAGATASYGTVVEPCNYTQKFPNTQVLLPHYFRGETVLEAYWKSVAWPGEGIFVGEPLARPFGGVDVELSDGTLVLRTTQLNPAKTYELRAAEAEAGPYEVIRGDITIPHHQLATITLPNATAPFYELAEVGN